MDNSDGEDNGDGIVTGDKQEENSLSKNTTRLGMKFENFFDIIKLHTCLFNRSQTLENKTMKQNALHQIKVEIQNAYGVDLNTSQIRKKFENLKMRAKSKRDKMQKMDSRVKKLKYFEEEILRLMDYSNSSLPNFRTEHFRDVSADSSNFFKFETEDEMSRDDEEEISKPPPPPSVISDPEIDIKSETNESIHFEQVNELNYDDAATFTSDDEHQLDTIEEEEDKSTTARLGFGVKDKDFFDIIKCYSCLFEKSQAPHVNEIKKDALRAIREHIISHYGINLNNSQIRKKINNMKARAKKNLYKSIRRDAPTFKLKAHERQLLNLMKCKKILGPKLCIEENTSDDSNEEQEIICSHDKTELPSSSLPQCLDSKPISNENDEFEKLSVDAMKREVLIEQKELNRQQNELNSLRKEILTLKKEKLLLEISLLKKEKMKNEVKQIN